MNTGAPVLVEWMRGRRHVRSVCFVLWETESMIHAAATLDGERPMGHVDFERNQVIRVVPLTEAVGRGA